MKKLVMFLSLALIMGVVSVNAQDKKPAAKPAAPKTEAPAAKKEVTKEAKAPKAKVAKKEAKAAPAPVKK